MSKEVDYRGAWQLMMGANTLALVSHVGPDGDTLGSALGSVTLSGKPAKR